MAASTNAFFVRLLVLTLVSTPVVFCSSEETYTARLLLQTSTGGTPGLIGGTTSVPGATPTSSTGTPSTGSTFIPPSASGVPPPPPRQSPISLPTIPAPAPAFNRPPAPVVLTQGPVPIPGRAPTVSAPAPSPRNLSPVPAPAASNTSGLAANGTSPSPAPRNASSPVPAPAGLANQTGLAPSPVPAPAPQNAPAPAPNRIANQTVPSPAPVPAPAQNNAPGPAPNSLRNQITPSPAPVPAPAPNNAPVPAPNSQGNLTAPSPGPAPVQVPAPAPSNSLGLLANRPAPGPAPSVRNPAPVPSQAQAPAPVPSPSIGLGSTAPILPGPAPEPVSAPVPAPAPNNGLLANQNPSQAPRPSPVQAPSPVLVAPVPAPNAPVPAPNAPTLSVGSQQPTPAPGPAPGQGLTFRTAPSPSTVLAAAPTPSVTGALGPNGVLSPSANLIPTLAPGPSALLRELYPALAPAPSGDAATRVTVAANGQTGIVKVVDSRTGLARSALPSDLSSGESLYAPAGAMNVVVQTSTSQSNLPVNAISAEGATVNSVTPVQGSDGRLFNVGLTSNPGASSVAVSTIAGVTLTSGLTTLASNRLQINIASPNPQVSIRSGSGYENGQSVTPSFNIDFGGRVTANDPSGLYTLDGVERSDVVYDIQNGRIFITTYIPEAEANTSRIITVTVPAGVTTDLSGTPNSAAQYIYNYTPKNPKFTTVSNVVNGVAGAGMGVAVVTPLAIGLLSTGPASATAAAVGTFTVLNLFRGLQFTYLAGQMRILNMPPNFRQVANSFQWSVLDFRAPWQTARGNTVSQQRQTTGFSNTPQGVTGSPAGRKLLEDEQFMRKLLAPALAPISANNGTINLPSATGGNSQYVVTSTGLNQTAGQSSGAVAAASDLVGTVTDAALGQTEDPYDTLWRAIFWTAIGLVAVTAIVIGLSTLFIFLNWSVPVILQSPRPQLMMLIIAVPSVAQACAGLFASGGGKDIAVGVVICVVFPAVMFLFAAIFVARHIYRDNRRRAAYVLEGDPELQEKEKPTLISRILDVVVGPKGKAGQWMALKQRDSRFVNQYGPLFEMNLGPPMVLNGVTYDVDPKTGYCNRGQLVPLYEKPVFKLGRLVIYPHQLQGQNASYEIAQGIATAILLKSFTQPNSFAQVITLIVINVLMLLWLRLIRPVGDRTALIMSMIGTLSTLGTYICGLILLANKDASPAFRDRVGIAMIVLSLWGVVTMLLGWIAHAIFAYHLFIMLRKWAFPSTDPAHKFARVVEKVMARDEYILARKFGDRWMRKALGVGLHKRTLLRRERERKLDRFREVVFLGVRNQKGRVVNVGKKPGKTGQDGQKPTGAAAWPGMPALSNLKTNAANGNGYHANGKTSLEASGRDTDRILSGLTSSQPTTPMSLEKREIESDPNRDRPKQAKTGNVTQTVNPLGEQSNTSPEREARRSLNPPEPNHVVVEMGEPMGERRGRISPNRSPSREERAQRARDRWSRRFQNEENKEN